MKIVPPTPDGIREAAQAVRAGEIVAYPTETVYGLAADPFSEEAVARLFDIKERDRGKPVLLIVANAAQLAGVVSAVSPEAEACIRAFWPGPLSLLLPKAAWLAPGITAGAEKVCVRETSCPIARTLCEYTGHAVTSTSANPSGGEPARSIDEMDMSGIAIAIDGGLLPFSPPSTVYDPDERRILREGAISGQTLWTTLFP
ncbi:MAG TPA: L-threonylcarbamoyladenylate synthase [Candidatus Hydrogenedentes bacterium]|mgnify:FL=1|nr:L-threonylcarbamoyladenylate synthase [Candidatus Hydrogenedentota bacterium]HOT49788.1 L-threonylcarbamoyladenylate synthase [Candidatus Hydrogenedentota bacterium]HOV75385.1 L-threonylcarbamoyladenylate synthase [Candidatus Hydrogenedentota bacterium]HPC15629.1 L-threonylcarbamoyladenylate synthase [Candidatus Hydrogenedentota bacterium]HRT19449.1 L-threonylcarbamoyladenylate synthase [Candidatus Hydrogenedentota bacterium]